MLRSNAMLILVMFCCAVLCGCTTTSTQSVDARDFNQMPSVAGGLDAGELKAGDALEVSVEVDGRMEYPSHRAIVNQRGYVTLPLVGDVRVGGVGLEAARAVIAKSYSAYYVSAPVVMVALVGADGTSEWGRISVMGRVSNPGPVQLTSGSGMRLSAAIQAAGGFATSARTSEIQVTRIDSTGSKIRVVVDFNEIGKSGNADSDLMLRDGDIIYVPERVF